ncbi:tRNA (guanosine(46)-N7)-methyltransferase TrmB [Pararhodospirillum photometricum]|uniref:tRNA (guanine-N(7)-)-methyltransferase n=1 Tax=Pararhodospirillum photometricum DSM 122 TaxID=1150469 RepID=H6SMD1_PARPM|nr:tRNA (guanosine(46)-N7)-methyltransferase TrmB [Pararhodospirillum photometricum]CCG06814.1 tRNA (guanine-N(7)-)-methyltransferase [Pararhodospirillum photometricum DSM 122]
MPERPETPRTSSGDDERFYGRRKGKPLRAGRQKLFDTLLPALTVPLAGLAEGETLDPQTLFSPPRQALWLEIGFGGGEHLVAQAEAHPEVGVIGAEVFEYGVGKALSLIDAAGVRNIRVWPEDVRALLTRLPEACLDRLFVLFPDPWPKTRHARRRMIQPARLDLFAALLKDGGELRVASDDAGYVRWTLQHATAHPLFRWTATGPGDWRDPPADWVQTRYEAKALAAGRRPAYLVFQRLPRPTP